LEYWSIGVLEYWSIGVLEYWSTGVLEYWSIEVSEYWSVGVLECWSTGVLEYWGVGVLGCWSTGVLRSIRRPDGTGPLSRRDSMIVARHEVPRTIRKKPRPSGTIEPISAYKAHSVAPSGNAWRFPSRPTDASVSPWLHRGGYRIHL
jgi:hypothetical protein